MFVGEEMLPGQCPILGKRHAQVRKVLRVGSATSDIHTRLNVKLDGINSIPDLPSLTDPAHPTIIMGKLDSAKFLMLN